MTSLYTNLQELLKTFLHTKTEDTTNFNNITPTYTGGVLSYGELSNLTGFYLTDEDMPSSMPKNCTHSITYSSPYTRIRLNDNVSGSRYYMTIPFYNDTGNINVSVDFYTTGMDNDDFGIRLCDKKTLEDNNTFKSYGAWIVTGQGRLVFGYGGLETSSTKYLDVSSVCSNNIVYNFTMKLTTSTVYYCLKRLDNNTIIRGGTYNRSDSYSWSGLFYLYIGGGKFSYGSSDKSVYLKNLRIY